MRKTLLFLSLMVCWWLVGSMFDTDPVTVEANEGTKPVKFNAKERQLWTTSKVVGSPEPPAPYKAVRSYPKISFQESLEIVAIPGRDVWAVAERSGKITSFDMDPAKAEKKPLMDLKRITYGMAMHPKFATNGYMFLTSIFKEGDKEISRISRFSVDLKTLTADPTSEKVIFTWPAGGHNGGCIRFGPDGMLYLATGDGSGIADELQTGQDLSDVLAAMLRIDVDNPDAGKEYGIPPSNPFVKMTGARGENYAYGLRQVWKFSFDSKLQHLWAGEVGQDLWESVLIIEKGGNYGWSVNEGTKPFRPERKKGPTPILKPIYEHAHHESRSITGGFVYRGKKRPELEGQYIYGDYDTGRIWALQYDHKTQKVTQHRELIDTPYRIVAWGQDHNGEIYALDYVDGGIYHLEPAPPADPNAPKFPEKLSETGLFASTKDHIPANGLIPYAVNSELWSDGASKERFMAIPGKGKIEYETMTYPQPAPGSFPGWRFPDGTVFVKTFMLETEPGKKRRLETRLLVCERVAGNEDYGDQVWTGYTYIWNDDQTDAVLADKNGVDKEYTVKTKAGERKQKWHYPSRSECMTCHTVCAKYALGVNTQQLNRDYDYGHGMENQLTVYDQLGLFDRKLPAPPEKLKKIVDYKDEKASLDDRAKAYMFANCSHCHRKWGGGNAEFQLLNTLELKDTGTIGIKPAHGTFGLNDPKLLVPGEPDRSVIYHRMKMMGLGRMPHIGSNVVDEAAVKLIHDWIEKLPK